MYRTTVVPDNSHNGLYAQYIKEREGRETIYHLEGAEPVAFATYKDVGPAEKVEPGIYIVDIYVKQGYRDRGIAKKLADRVVEIAKETNKDWIYGSVDINANGSEASTQVLIAYGFKYKYVSNTLLFFEKWIRG